MGCVFAQEEICGLTCCYLISSPKKNQRGARGLSDTDYPFSPAYFKALNFDSLPGDWVKDLSSGVGLEKIVIIKSWFVDCLVPK